MIASPDSPLRVVFTAVDTVELESFDLGAPAAEEVQVRTRCSLMSTGTEGIVLHRLFSPDTNFASFGAFPFFAGYAAVGVVEQVGAGVTSLSPGQLVVLRRGHASHHVLAARDCVIVPVGIPDDDAAWFALATIAFRGYRATDVSVGDDVLVVGAGPVGQMLLRWLVVAGAGRIVVVDPFEERLSFALQGGASIAIAKSISDAAAEIAAGSSIPRIIVDTTGNAQVFRSLLRIAPKYGRIVLLGDTGHPEEQRLTQDVVVNGLTITGAHDGHDRDGWTGRSVSELFFRLLASHRFSVDGLITHRFAPERAADAYALTASHRAQTMGVLFDWRDRSGPGPETDDGPAPGP